MPSITPRAGAAELHVAFVGSYVPRRCGIATFTADTLAAVRAADPGLDVEEILARLTQVAEEREVVLD